MTHQINGELLLTATMLLIAMVVLATLSDKSWNLSLFAILFLCKDKGMIGKTPCCSSY